MGPTDNLAGLRFQLHSIQLLGGKEKLPKLFFHEGDKILFWPLQKVNSVGQTSQIELYFSDAIYHLYGGD